MIIHHARGLHKSIADRAANELKSTADHIPAHSIRFCAGNGWRVADPASVSNRLPLCKLPDIGIEGSKFPLRCQEALRVF